MTDLLLLWRGDVPLDRAFWRYAVVGGAIVNLVTSFLFLLLFSADMVFLAVLFGYGVSLPYNLLALVGVWRAAARETEHRARGDLYRLVTVVGMILLSVT